MAFLNFCRTLTDGYELSDPYFSEVHNPKPYPPVRYKGPSDVLIKNMRIKKDIIDKVDIPYIQNVFKGYFTVLIDKKLKDREVPNTLIEYLADGIYGKRVNELTKDQRRIIKVLSVYICIQN